MTEAFRHEARKISLREALENLEQLHTVNAIERELKAIKVKKLPVIQRY